MVILWIDGLLVGGRIVDGSALVFDTGISSGNFVGI